MVIAKGAFSFPLHHMFIAAGMDVARGNVQSTVVSLIYGAGFLGTFSPWLAGYLVDRFAYTAPFCMEPQCRCWPPHCSYSCSYPRPPGSWSRSLAEAFSTLRKRYDGEAPCLALRGCQSDAEWMCTGMTSVLAGPQAVSARESRRLMRGTLRDVSRSFYLSIRVLPAGLQGPIGLAYLLARAADTIADTALLRPDDRLRLLLLFRAQLETALRQRRLWRLSRP